MYVRKMCACCIHVYYYVVHNAMEFAGPLIFIVYTHPVIRVINGYNEFQETALKVPEDSKDMMDQIEYVQEAQATIVNQLKESVEVSVIDHCVCVIYV